MIKDQQSTQEIDTPSIETLCDLIIESIQDVKGKNIIKLDLREIEDAPAEIFIICEGDSTTQVNGIADKVKVVLKTELGVSPSHVEGQVESKWVLLDYFNIVVHIFYPETRLFYGLEDLWSDGNFTEYQNL